MSPVSPSPNGANEPYSPIRDKANLSLYARYRRLSARERPTTRLGGRLGAFRYLDIDDTIAAAFRLVAEELR